MDITYLTTTETELAGVRCAVLIDAATGIRYHGHGDRVADALGAWLQATQQNRLQDMAGWFAGRTLPELVELGRKIGVKITIQPPEAPWAYLAIQDCAGCMADCGRCVLLDD